MATKTLHLTFLRSLLGSETFKDGFVQTSVGRHHLHHARPSERSTPGQFRIDAWQSRNTSLWVTDRRASLLNSIKSFRKENFTKTGNVRRNLMNKGTYLNRAWGWISVAEIFGNVGVFYSVREPRICCTIIPICFCNKAGYDCIM